MSRLKQKFADLKAQGETGLVPFITAGDPSLNKTKAYVKALVDGGADVIELGMPFSDPMADGPVIQEADERSLAKGTDLNGILKIVSELRKTTEVPIVLMGYYNPIFAYGVERFARDAVKAGVDGCLIADLPVEESSEIKPLFKQAGLDLIFLLAPTSHNGRIKAAAKVGQGYLYYVSMTGITGAQLSGTKWVEKKVKAIKALTDLPVAVGFGIATPDAAARVSQFADAVVVGSAFVKQIAQGITPAALENMTRKFKRAMK